MKKLLLFLFWVNFFVMMSVPLILVSAVRFHNEAVLNYAPFYAILWLLNAALLLTAAFYIGFKISKTPTAAVAATVNAKEIIILILFTLLGAGISLMRNAVPSTLLWNTLLVYWILFTFLILIVLQRFIDRCQKENILS